MKNIPIKKTKKYFWYIIFIYKNGKEISSKTQREASKRSTWKISKSFWKKKRKESI